ncbi:MAG: glycosyltransferase family 4 protein [bacterium]|nr:glycosyltransferase family 4 protein [bacterium]
MRLAVDARVLVHRPTGVARYLGGLLDEWPALRREDDRLTLFVDRPAQQELPGAADDVRALRWPLPGGDPAWRQLRLGPHVSERVADVLFCPFYTVPLVARVPSVVTIHDVSFAANPQWFSRRARVAFALAAPSATRAAAVLTVSEFSAGEIERHLGVPRERIHVTHLGIAPHWFEPVESEARRALREWLGSERPFVLHLGAVHERRRPDLLLDGFAAVAAERPDLDLVIAGPTISPAPDLESRLGAPGLAGRVLRREWVPDELLRPLLAEARALTYLSAYEGFGLPALEALASATPVVALRRASLPEVLGDCAEWIDEERADSVAAALTAVLEDEFGARERARRGVERARGFTWKRAAERTFDLLRRCSSGS